MAIRACVTGAFMNVRINAKDLKDRDIANNLIERGAQIYKDTVEREQKITNDVFSSIQ